MSGTTSDFYADLAAELRGYGLERTTRSDAKRMHLACLCGGIFPAKETFVLGQAAMRSMTELP